MEVEAANQHEFSDSSMTEPRICPVPSSRAGAPPCPAVTPLTPGLTSAPRPQQMCRQRASVPDALTIPFWARSASCCLSCSGALVSFISPPKDCVRAWGPGRNGAGDPEKGYGDASCSLTLAQRPQRGSRYVPCPHKGDLLWTRAGGSQSMGRDGLPRAPQTSAPDPEKEMLGRYSECGSSPNLTGIPCAHVQ